MKPSHFQSNIMNEAHIFKHILRTHLPTYVLILDIVFACNNQWVIDIISGVYEDEVDEGSTSLIETTKQISFARRRLDLAFNSQIESIHTHIYTWIWSWTDRRDYSMETGECPMRKCAPLSNSAKNNFPNDFVEQKPICSTKIVRRRAIDVNI